MHEYALCSPFVDTVLHRAGGRPVRRVVIRAGVTHGVDTPSMQQAFEMLAAGTVASDAAVEVQVVPVEVTCRDCGFDGTSLDLLAACAQCGGDDVARSGGDELVLVSIAY